MSEHKYGRGKFEAHPLYIEYMREIVEHPNYVGMPNAMPADGRIYWQVSSGKTTSFYKDYIARWAWWEQKADSLGLAGKGSENDRFTVAARCIHPSGYRVCRLCGKRVNVGYFYANHHFAKNVEKVFGGDIIKKLSPITEVIQALNVINPSAARQYFHEIFPERGSFFLTHGVSTEAFEASRHVRTGWLSPGFMGNPPDRLDGFHDYCTFCRKEGDPGRSDENMRTYNHDRRSFEWWAEGDWFVADALYNSAGFGSCSVAGCKETNLAKVSPDHIGPLACGFKQLPLFLPTCNAHNSAKNRRFTLGDVALLIDYEKTTGESVASWQIRSHWNKYKSRVSDDNQTKALSNSLRSLQDMYLRVLWRLNQTGRARFLATLLHPEYAFRKVLFENLDSGRLTYKSIATIEKRTPLRNSLAARTIAIAFESLGEYAKKQIEARKMVRSDFDDNSSIIDEAISKVNSLPTGSVDAAWTKAIDPEISRAQRVELISQLLDNGKVPTNETDKEARALISGLFDTIGQSAEIDFSRYAMVPELDI